MSDFDRRKALFLTASAPFISGCSLLTESHTVRFRAKLSLLQDGAVRTAETVLEGRWGDTAGYGQGERWVARFFGNAICINTKPNGMIVGLLGTVQTRTGGFSCTNSMFYNLAPEIRRDNNGGFWRDLASLQGERDIPKYYWPVLVSLPDISDPESVVFLPESMIQGFTFRITTDPISSDIEKRLPWLDRAGRYDGPDNTPMQSRPVFAQLRPENFRY